MLVLSRKKGESIQIAENISITVTEVRGGRVRLSIDAPRSVRIVRGEIAFDGQNSDFLSPDVDRSLQSMEFSPTVHC